MGCTYGGTVNGSGEFIYDETMTYTVSITGAVTGELNVIFDLASDMIHVDGFYNGEEVEVIP